MIDKERKKDLIIRTSNMYRGKLVHNMISADCATDYQSEVQRGRSQRCAGDRLLCIIGVEVLLFVGIIFICVICWDNFILVGGMERKSNKG